MHPWNKGQIEIAKQSKHWCKLTICGILNYPLLPTYIALINETKRLCLNIKPENYVLQHTHVQTRVKNNHEIAIKKFGFDIFEVQIN